MNQREQRRECCMNMPIHNCNRKKKEAWKKAMVEKGRWSLKSFNTTAVCIPSKHYMVDLTERVHEIKKIVDDGKYFTINRARQYGKTTTIDALITLLQEEYIVLSLDFQDISDAVFKTEGSFVKGMCRIICDTAEFMDTPIPDRFRKDFEELNGKPDDSVRMDELFRIFMRWFKESKRLIVLIIDEVDSATNNQVFLDFLAQLRSLYLKRKKCGGQDLSIRHPCGGN